jgi:integrase
VLAGRIDEVAGQLETGASLLADQVRWLNSLTDVLHARLVKWLPIPPRVVRTLGEWLDELKRRKIKHSEGGRRRFAQACTRLEGFFGRGRGLRDITSAHAAEWRLKMLESLSEATVRTDSGYAKEVFATAVREKVLSESPVAGLESGSTPRDDFAYVPAVEVLKVMGELKDEELRLRVGLCRFAGVRVDSEPSALLWSQVDFEHRRFVLPSKKTQRYAGKKFRIVPIVDVVLPLLRQRFEVRDPGEEHVFSVRTLSGWHKGLVERAIASAGVKRWPALFQTLRSSFDQDIRDHVPDYAADLVTGHGTGVSRKHYTRSVPDEIFGRMFSLGSEKAAQKAAHHLAELPVTTGQSGEADRGNSGKNEPSGAGARILVPVGAMGDEGLEPPTSRV